MKFEWSDEKSKKSYLKHGVDFEEAQTVFRDASALEYFDALHSVDEDRLVRVGFSERGRILVVIYCEREIELIRIISARTATKMEMVIYEKRI
ncbi:MAG: BrnT family toxin [Bdellovibrionota bacterium]